MPGENQIERLVERSIEVAHLPSDIAHPYAVHQTQEGAIELGKQAWNCASTRLATVLTQRHIASPMEPIFDPPMISVQLQKPFGRSLAHRKAAEAIHHLVTDFPGFQDLGGAFESKDLFNPLPLLGEPVIEIRATDHLAMFAPSMPFLPGFCLLPAPPIRGRIFKEIRNVLAQRGLVVFGNQQILPLQPMYLRTQRSLGMHRV